METPDGKKPKEEEQVENISRSTIIQMGAFTRLEAHFSKIFEVLFHHLLELFGS